MKMGTAQKQNISVQHRMWNRYDSRPKQAIPEFSEWFLNGVRTFEAKGAEFELLQGMVKIQWPGKVTILRTVSDFKREYESCYLRQEITA
jgi:hypothetical protein